MEKDDRWVQKRSVSYATRPRLLDHAPNCEIGRARKKKNEIRRGATSISTLICPPGVGADCIKPVPRTSPEQLLMEITSSRFYLMMLDAEREALPRWNCWFSRRKETLLSAVNFWWQRFDSLGRKIENFRAWPATVTHQRGRMVAQQLGSLSRVARRP